MIDRLYRVLRNEDVSFEINYLPTDPKDQSITLGLHLDEDFGSRILVNVIDLIVPTIVHECLHEIFPQKEEKDILRLERRLVYILSRTQKRNIFNLWLERVGGIRKQ
jgi:hypothetical protein